VSVGPAVRAADGAQLFIDAAKVGPDVAAHLAAAGVTQRPYCDVSAALREASALGRRVLADPAKVSLALFDAVEVAAGGATTPKGSKRAREPRSSSAAAASVIAAPLLVEAASPIAMAKAVKNAAELAGFREAHLRDAAALANFFAWLDEAVAAGELVTEASLATKLESLRAQQPGFIEPSFPTIAGAGPNGAIIHYRPVEGACASVAAGTLLLLDSGGQYDCGTTDVTRTTFLGPGEPRADQRDAFTRVLQGHIALDSAIFPEGTPGFVLDAFARRALWQAGLDYRHGTGHGVGAALNVHEGPHGIAPRYGNTTGLVAGMIVSNEPGFYADGQWGIRIENLVALREEPTQFRFGGSTFLGFERLTLVPIQRKMLAMELLSVAEVSWLNTYHSQVWQHVSPRVQGAALDWLRAHTLPL
jgi:Xaa-Pro aminopeptidase